MNRRGAISNSEFIAFLFSFAVLLAIGLTITYFARQYFEQKFVDETAVLDENPDAVPAETSMTLQVITIVAGIGVVLLIMFAAYRISKLQRHWLDRRAERRSSRLRPG